MFSGLGDSFKKTYATLTSRTWLIAWTMLAGSLCPAAHVYSPAIRWLVMLMLGLTYLGVELSRHSVQRLHLTLLVIPPLLGLLVGLLLRPWQQEVALSAALVALTPTATAAPVILSLLGRRSDFGAAAVVLSNLAAAFYLPPMLTFLSGPIASVQLGSMVTATLLTMVGPFLITVPLRRWFPGTVTWRYRRGVSFLLWLMVLFLVAAQTSHFLRESMQPPWWRVGAIMTASLLLCVGQFALGRWLGRPDWAVEASQCLGQKNTMLTIWVASTWLSPMIAIGPASYVIWHNLYNSWQLRRGAARSQDTGS